MVGALSFEAVITNLDVLHMGTPEAVCPVGIWGPAILAQIEDELISGVCTFNGRLRMVSLIHNPLGDLLDRFRDILDAAC